VRDGGPIGRAPPGSAAAALAFGEAGGPPRQRCPVRGVAGDPDGLPRTGATTCRPTAAASTP